MKTEKGLILIELLTAIAIFSIGIMTIFALFVNATKGAIASLDRTAALFTSLEATEAAYSIANSNNYDLFPGEYEVGINSDSQWVLIPRTGLMGHFLLSNNAIDSSNNQNNGVMNNMSFGINRKNQRYSAARFNGSNSYIQTQYAFSLQITGPLTISAWVSGTGQGTRYIAGKYNMNQARGGYVLSKADSYYNFQIGGPEAQDSISGASDNLPWEHIVGVYDPGKPSIHLYINGKLKGSKTTNISSINRVPDIEFFIGTDASKANVWQGLISDVRIYNRTLTSNEISGLYNKYSNKYDQYLVVKDIDEGLMGNWNFNEKETCIAHDNSGNNNHGILRPECDILSPSWTQDKYGKQDQALEFDGVNDFINVPDHSSLQIQNQISICAWVKIPDPVPDNSGIILHKRASNTQDYSFALIYNKDNNGYDWAVCSGALENLASIQSVNTVMPGKWQYIVAVFDGINKKLYIDNSKIDNTTVSTLDNSGVDSNFYIGQQADGNNKYKGIIDNVRIYNHALSESEIMSLFLENINYYTQ